MKWIVVITIVSLAMTQAHAAPAYYSDTNHYYEPVAILHLLGDGFTWHEVSALAEASTHLGVQGHLATITSAEENQFVADLCDTLGHDTFYWLGGFQPDGTSEPDGDWRWITGEPWGYTNWKIGDPSDSGTFGIEDHVGIVGSSAQGLLGQWNDMYSGLNPDRDWSSYVIEYPVPEPATLSLLTLAAIALVRRRKRGVCR